MEGRELEKLGLPLHIQVDRNKNNCQWYWCNETWDRLYLCYYHQQYHKCLDRQDIRLKSDKIERIAMPSH